MPQNNPPHNPYAQAAGAYSDNAQKNSPDQRELEARILLKSAKMLADLQGDLEAANLDVIEKTLKYNRQIWMMFYDTALENPNEERPNDLRSNIINLANFIFKREVDILAAPERQKFDVLININKEIAAGLMTQVSNTASAETTQEQEKPQSVSTDT